MLGREQRNGLIRRQPRTRRLCFGIAVGWTFALLWLCLLGPSAAWGYGLYKYGCGRDGSDFRGRYDFIGDGTLFPQKSGDIYQFGNIGAFATLPPNLTGPDVVKTAVNNATADWAGWANIGFGTDFGPANTGLLRLVYVDKVRDSTGNFVDYYGARTWGYGLRDPYATIEVGQKRTATDDWTPQTFEAVILHELGHVLGLADLYNNPPLPAPDTRKTEEFVDHDEMAGNPKAERPGPERADNIMNGGWPGEVIDNDEIAAVAWNWGSEYNQIVSGQLVDVWDATDYSFRNSDYHHGDQIPNPLGWWDYRGTIGGAGSMYPYIDLEFPGYIGYDTAKSIAYNNDGSWMWLAYGGNQGGSTERFIIEDPNFVGNFTLCVQSIYPYETRIPVEIFGGGRTDYFDLAPSNNGLVFQAPSAYEAHWVKPFGPNPIPEPVTALAVLAGLGTLVAYARKRLAD